VVADVHDPATETEMQRTREWPARSATTPAAGSAVVHVFCIND